MIDQENRKDEPMTFDEMLEDMEFMLEASRFNDSVQWNPDMRTAALEKAIELLKTLEQPQEAYWIHCKGKSHIWYCSHCGEKINYNNAHKVYTKAMKPIDEVNRYCRCCGFAMRPCSPTGEQEEQHHA